MRETYESWSSMIHKVHKYIIIWATARWKLQFQTLNVYSKLASPPSENLATANPRHSLSIALKDIQEILRSHILFKQNNARCNVRYGEIALGWGLSHTAKHQKDFSLDLHCSRTVAYLMCFTNLFSVVVRNSKIHIRAIYLKTE